MKVDNGYVWVNNNNLFYIKYIIHARWVLLYLVCGYN